MIKSILGNWMQSHLLTVSIFRRAPYVAISCCSKGMQYRTEENSFFLHQIFFFFCIDNLWLL